MRPGEVPLNGPIEEKIAWAEACSEIWKIRLADTPAIAAMLSRLRGAIQASCREMAAAGITSLCRRCEREEGGSCCGEGLENRYDPWLLLINLLLGVLLPHHRQYPRSCFFLGDQGCRLRARHTICVNYLCGKVANRIDPLQLRELREREGEELNALFLLTEEIKRAVRTRQ